MDARRELGSAGMRRGWARMQILICQNLRNNLQHPNEFLRGVTLRFLCRIREEEILEPLIPSILACLDHRHSYVRRWAPPWGVQQDGASLPVRTFWLVAARAPTAHQRVP